MNHLFRRQCLPKTAELIANKLNPRFLQQQAPSSNIARRLLAACIVSVFTLASELQLVCLHIAL